jgi:hypothetical protein
MHLSSHGTTNQGKVRNTKGGPHNITVIIVFIQ